MRKSILFFIILILIGTDIFGEEIVRASSTLSSKSGKLYRAENVRDHNIETAWVEGVEGNGIGEWIEILVCKDLPMNYLDNMTIMIIPGYAKDRKRWEKNNSVKKARLTFKTSSVSWDTIVEFKALPAFGKGSSIPTLYLKLSDWESKLNRAKTSLITLWCRLTILEVYPGTKYKDTCISEFEAFFSKFNGKYNGYMFDVGSDWYEIRNSALKYDISTMTKYTLNGIDPSKAIKELMEPPEYDGAKPGEALPKTPPKAYNQWRAIIKYWEGAGAGGILLIREDGIWKYGGNWYMCDNI